MGDIFFLKRGRISEVAKIYNCSRKTIYNILRNPEHKKHTELVEFIKQNDIRG